MQQMRISHAAGNCDFKVIRPNQAERVSAEEMMKINDMLESEKDTMLAIIKIYLMGKVRGTNI